MNFTMDINPKLIALHKHWCAADSINFHLRRSLEAFKNSPQKEDLAANFSMFLALSVWYAMLYVVVEGYKEIGAQDVDIDALIGNTDNVDALRRFRNATFHYQEDPLSDKLMTFLVTKDSETWIGELNRALKRFFERELPIREILASMGM